MYGFPINSQGSVNTFTNNADSGFPKIQQKEVFYSVKDGLWTDSNSWQTASGRVGLIPTANDDVYIRNTISTNASGTNVVNCFNLFNNGTLVFSMNGGGPSFINVFGNIRSTGIIEMSLSASSHTLNLYGADNSITGNIITTINSTISYCRSGDQQILDLQYRTLIILNPGTKYPINNIVCDNITIGGSSTLNMFWFNLTCNNACGFGQNAVSPGTFIANYGNYILVKGLATFRYGSNISSNGTVYEFQNGAYVQDRGATNWDMSGSIIKFTTTSNQVIQGNVSINAYWDTVLIDSGITLTNINVNLYLSNAINGIGPTSKLINQGNILFTNQISAQNSMATGIVDFATSTNTIQYTGNYSATIPSYFTTFHNLTISGTGTKSLGVNTTLNGNLASSGTFELSTYDLIVTGTTTTTGGTGYVSKNSSGNILFIGAVSLGNGSGAGGFNFSGNPNVEFRNGITTNNNGTMVMGSGNYSFTTNNQTIFLFPGGAYSYPNATIVGAITVTWTGGALGTYQNALSGFVINPIGTTASSKLVNNGNIFFNGIPSAVMSTGIFDITTNVNNVTYNYNGDDTLPFTTYSSLTINGSGTKTLSGNTTLNGSLYLSGNSLILECSTYNLTVNGTFGGQPTNSSFPGKISKTGSGSLLFVGSVSTNTINWVLSSNPTIEFRNGLILSNINTSIHNMGTGQITFSTNSQNIAWSNTVTFNNNILISGAITITQGSTLYNTSTIMNGVLNGDNALSKWLMGTLTNSMTYNNATQPMSTGILDTSTNLNTWIYGGTNQDIKGGPTIGAKQVHRNLRFSTSGSTKTLQGYVSVLNTYTLDSGVTVNNNGYTLTNP